VLAKLNPMTLALLRLFTAFMFWQHGAQKLLGWFGGQAQPMTLSWAAGGLEFFGAILILIGLFTRPVAALLALDMAILYLTQYLPKGFPPVLNINGEVACLLLAIAALLVFTGAEKLSLDAVLKQDPMADLFARHRATALGIFRIAIGLLFIQHGMQKWFGMFGAQAVPVGDLRFIAGQIEFWGGIAIALGVLTRPIAFLCCGEMAVAYFMNHNSRGFWPILNAGERAVLFCYIFLFMVTAGPGRFALDNILRRKTSRAHEPVPVRN
jgi:putative oxidoreductase